MTRSFLAVELRDLPSALPQQAIGSKEFPKFSIIPAMKILPIPEASGFQCNAQRLRHPR